MLFRVNFTFIIFKLGLGGAGVVFTMDCQVFFTQGENEGGGYINEFENYIIHCTSNFEEMFTQYLSKYD